MPLAPETRRKRRAMFKEPVDVTKLERKRCKNCPKFFWKTRPNKEFCSPECKKQFHEHGAAFGPLKDRLEKLVTRWMREHKATIDSQFAQIQQRLEKLEQSKGD